MRYSTVAIALHWLIAALVAFELGTGISFGRFDPGDSFFFPSAYAMHMSVGIALLVCSVLRVAWRLMHRSPPLPQGMGLASRALAHASHTLLYVYILAVPFTGWVVLSARRKPVLLFDGVHWPTLPWISNLAHPNRTLIHEAALPTHIWLSYAGIGLIVLHVVAALYHHFYKRDDVLRRMLPGA